MDVLVFLRLKRLQTTFYMCSILNNLRVVIMLPRLCACKFLPDCLYRRLNDVKYGRHILALYEVSGGWLLAFTPVILSTIKLLYCSSFVNVE